MPKRVKLVRLMPVHYGAGPPCLELAACALFLFFELGLETQAPYFIRSEVKQYGNLRLVNTGLIKSHPFA